METLSQKPHPSDVGSCLPRTTTWLLPNKAEMKRSRFWVEILKAIFYLGQKFSTGRINNFNCFVAIIILARIRLPRGSHQPRQSQLTEDARTTKKRCVTGALGQKYKGGLALRNQGTHLEDSKE
ncbi:hypothetical protein O181_013382 [Austropuccinia psidii MF-1]|uniref:Uncharacterized protein n=1 Tax=Austropuccinia psidii MF-1 TaxID=1389203 RepID=A0A9Q3GNW2_9BASI|nr:hypothetical protein [Austropuccinia psidii MF-1]